MKTKWDALIKKYDAAHQEEFKGPALVSEGD